MSATSTTTTSTLSSQAPLRSLRRRWLALIVLCFGQLMIAVDVTVVNVALPTLQRDLHFSQSSLAWVVDAYLITFGGLLLLAGRLGDLIGPKKVFITGLAVFTVASAFCGFAQNQAELITARFVQGAGAAIVAATIIGILVTTFPEPGEKGKAMGFYGFVASTGSALGLLAGGALTQALSWHWIFFINLPFGIAGIVLGSILIDERPGAGVREGVDVLGALTVTVAAMLLVYVIVRSDTYGWSSPRTIGGGLGAFALIAAFLWIESRVNKPIMPLRIFRSRNITGATIVRMLFPVAGLGVLFLGALYLQHVEGYGPIKTGLAFLPMTGLIAFTSLVVSSRIMARVGAKLTLLPGAGVLLIGMLLFGRIPVHANYVSDVLPAMVLVGIGMGTTISPSIALAMVDAAPADVGLVSGLANVSIQMGAAFGLAVLASVATSHTAHLLAHGSSRAAALVGGYRVSYVIAAGCLAASMVVAALVFRDRSVGRVLSAEQRAAILISESEMGL